MKKFDDIELLYIQHDNTVYHFRHKMILHHELRNKKHYLIYQISMGSYLSVNATTLQHAINDFNTLFHTVCQNLFKKPYNTWTFNNIIVKNHLLNLVDKVEVKA